MIRRLSIAALVCLLFGAPSAFAQDALILSVGAMNLAHNHQTIAGNDSALQAGTSGTYGVAWEQRHYNGIAYGAEYLIYNNQISAGGHDGQVTSRLVMFTLKKYHRPAPHIYPYVGVSAGLADTSVTGVSGGTGLGPALEVDGGVEFEWAHSLGFYTELRGIYAPSGSIYGTRANVSGVGLYAGLSLLF
ncbi:MAG: hypothetical protein ACYDEV_13920 [Acidiferrobacter sp.]